MKQFCLLFFLATPGVVFSDPLFPSPSVPDLTTEDGWSFGIGLGLEYETEYDGSDDYGVELDPGAVVQYRNGNQFWFLNGPELGWRSKIADSWLIQAGLRLEGDREESESPALAGLGDVEDEWTLMFEARRGFGTDWSNWLGARVMAGDGDIGVLGVLAAGHFFGANPSGNGVEAFVFATFGSSAFFNRDFGVTTQQSLDSGLPETDLSGGYRSLGIQVVGRWDLATHWQLVAEMGYEKYDNSISDSPIALDDFEAEAGVSVFYRF
ncbi:MAG: MipA/OmpV family protein [Pseudomonadota bacterium]